MLHSRINLDFGFTGGTIPESVTEMLLEQTHLSPSCRPLTKRLVSPVPGQLVHWAAGNSVPLGGPPDLKQGKTGRRWTEWASVTKSGFTFPALISTASNQLLITSEVIPNERVGRKEPVRA